MKRYALADSAQQVVGGFLLAGPFVVTEEVWVLARGMSWFQAVITACLVLGIGYGALYKADDDRDPDREAAVLGVPVRFVSLVLVSYLSVIVLALAFDAPGTFLADLGAVAPWRVTLLGTAFDGSVLGLRLNPSVLAVTLKAVSVGSVFSVIGAATADSLF